MGVTRGNCPTAQTPITTDHSTLLETGSRSPADEAAMVISISIASAPTAQFSRDS